ncbi:uncharacterized protein LOC121735642 isoform X2 [Aricia agestis]|uniref:uncharacterized protein LOC121735642 isoform X2 n=1 Tax=Aricia agestis TaxID=91739 RepID=UPI001C202DA4|nr:uncharacterized protein LOC121735642 isoform X2 [Aricia agestis]
MDNPLTPNKIQRLMHLAEDKSFNLPRRLALNEENLSSLTPSLTTFNKTGTNYESSSGILDLDKVEGFGESGIGNMSLSKSSVFNPGEMTGRSTGTEEVDVQQAMLGSARAFEEYGRHSVALDSITSHMDKQTSEINDIMRHSIATNYSFHSKRDLTADEASLVMREAPLPIQHSTQANFHESALLSTSNVSVGAYFKNRCPDFGRILNNVDSPDRRSVADTSNVYDESQNIPNQSYQMDQSLDCVPVRQPRSTETIPPPTQFNMPYNKPDFAIPKNPQGQSSVYTKSKETNNESAIKEKSMSVKKPFMTSTKPADVLLRNLHTSMRTPAEDTEYSMENSLSLSKIADYLGKQSNVSVTDLLQLNKQAKNNKKKPLTEINVNTMENKQNEEVYVAKLKDSKSCEMASSSGSMNTVLYMDKLKINEANNIPAVVVTRDSNSTSSSKREQKSHRMNRSNSPSSKSCSTLSTVQENKMSIKSGDSPINNNTSREQWADIITTPVEGYVGVSNTVTITVTTLSDSWLTARLEFDKSNKDVIIELPRLPLLLSPGKTEKFTLQLTSNIELHENLPFSLYMKDAAVDNDIKQAGKLQVDIKMPTVQAISSDGVNALTYPPIKERSSSTKYFVLISDCPVDLQLELFIAEGESMFSMKSVQEIRKTDVSKALMDRQVEESKHKSKGMNRQLCRLSSGNAIKVMVTFTAPKLSDLNLSDKMVTFKGSLHVNMIGIKCLMKKVGLEATVGTSSLVIQIPGSKLQLTNEPTTISLSNTGSIPGVWNIKFKGVTGSDGSFPFKVSAVCLDIRPGASKELSLMYTGPPDSQNEGILILEDASNGSKTTIEICGGSDKLKTFPIKTNYNNMSWVRSERKELSLKNSINKKIHLRCQIVGEGFSVDLPGVDPRGTFILTFAPFECRPLPILFSPNTNDPCAAALHLVFDKNSDFSRKIKLHGCAGDGGVRWSGLVTYGDTALVRAVAGAPVSLAVYNRARAPAFLAARTHFNLQYRWVGSQCTLSGARRVIGAGGRAAITMGVPWARLQRRRSATTALATVTLITGAEMTRRRILRIIRDESTGRLDTSLLPDHLKVLAENFDGEDLAMDDTISSFSETKASLNELFDSIQELTAQIDLPQELADENNTIIISDDTVVEHHTLCD